MIAVALIAALAAIYIAFSMMAKRRSEGFVQSERAPLHYSAVQIICADCSGDGETPVRTFMDRHGFCHRCGGSSYLLASTRAAYLRGQSAVPAVAGAEGRVLPFEARPKPVAPDRIAV